MDKMSMKKAAAAVFVLLIAITAVYAEPGDGAVLVARGETLRIQASTTDSLLAVDFQGKINGKPLKFERKDSVVINDGGLSDEEHRLIEIGLDLITSGFNRGKFEMPEMSFELKVINEGDALLATVKPLRGVASFEGKLEGGVNGKRFEFKQDASGAVIVNNGSLTESEVRVMEVAARFTKYMLQIPRDKTKKIVIKEKP